MEQLYNRNQAKNTKKTIVNPIIMLKNIKQTIRTLDSIFYETKFSVHAAIVKNGKDPEVDRNTDINYMKIDHKSFRWYSHGQAMKEDKCPK